jgi:hypothetical protein
MGTALLTVASIVVTVVIVAGVWVYVTVKASNRDT